MRPTWAKSQHKYEWIEGNFTIKLENNFLDFPMQTDR